MVPDWVITYIGGGLLVIIGYIIVSNTFWLLFGSRLAQYLPGVNIKGYKGTLKIALLILMSLIGIMVWLIKWPLVMVGIYKSNPFVNTLSIFIQKASRAHSRIIDRYD